VSEVQILSPRPVFVRNEVENEDCHGVAESEPGLLLKPKTDRCELRPGKPEETIEGFSLSFPLIIFSILAREIYMPKRRGFKIPREQINEFCRKNRIRKLSLFGSSLRDDFRPDSDLDILVEFEPGAHVGVIKLAGLELELSKILGREVDLNTPRFISKYYREQVLAEAEVQYDAA